MSIYIYIFLADMKPTSYDLRENKPFYCTENKN